MIKYFSFLLLLTALALSHCDAPETTSAEPENPAAGGFDLAGSDSVAIEIADRVMAAMGGRRAWDATRYISWSFLGRRNLVWDRMKQRVRIEALADGTVMMVSLEDKSGWVWRDGREMTRPDSVAKYLDLAYEIWINDSYWLVLPFKLKDSGVTLKHLGSDSTLAGEAADLLELRFTEVGVTPQNKYHVWVSRDSNLVSQWAWYRHYDDSEPGFLLPWKNYKRYGEILLSGDRGERGDRKLELSNISVGDSMAERLFLRP